MIQNIQIAEKKDGITTSYYDIQEMYQQIHRLLTGKFK